MGKIVGRCKLCGDDKEYKSLEAHLKLKHSMSYEDYLVKTDGGHSDKKEKSGNGINIDVLLEDNEEDIFEEMPDLDESQITPSEIAQKIFDIETPDENRLLTEFLEEVDMNEKQLRNLIDRYKHGVPIDVTQQLENRQKLGDETANQLKDKEIIETTELATAESLVDHHGYVVTAVKAGPPRRWVLKKK